MKFQNFTLLKLTICYCIGIILAEYTDWPIHKLKLGFLVFLCLFTTSFFFYNNALKQHTKPFSVLTFVGLTLLGMLSYTNSLAKNQAHHYSNFLKEHNTFIFKIEKRLKSNPYYNKYYAQVISTNNYPSQGRLLIQQKKDSTRYFKADESFVSTANINSIKPVLNPHQFDYKHYLKHQNVLYQTYLNSYNYKILNHSKRTYNGWNSKLIEQINIGFKTHHMGENELAIINALLLGQKQDISSALYKNYTNSGAIHILAVSGLHVGVLLLLLQYILTPLFHFKNGSLYKIFLIVIILWAFALLTGGSASVIRATTMFTIVTIAINIKRKTNIYNTLIASAFVILIFKPQFIFDVGFQLSYSAVFSIVAFQPLIVKLWKAPNKIIGFFWNTFSVTLAAQFAVLPISLFYFHQFPGLFWLSNLIIIPALPLILGLGLLCILGILLQLPEKITGVMVYGLEQLIAYMNQYLQWISSFENFIIKDIHFNPLLTISSLLLVVAVYCIWSQFNAKRFISLGVSIIGLQLSFLYSNYASNRNEFVIFHRSKSTQIALKKNASLNFYSHEAKENQLTRSYKIGSNVKTVLYDSLIPYFTINNTRIMIIDSTAIYDLKSFKPDIVLLTQSPKLNLERLIETIHPKKIIADGSNYKSYVKRWKETCKHKKGLFHTTEKGAYIYSF